MVVGFDYDFLVVDWIVGEIVILVLFCIVVCICIEYVNVYGLYWVFVEIVK